MSRKSKADLRNGRHFCILPWIHISLWTEGDLRPCCRVQSDYKYGSVREQSIESIWNDEPARKMRQELLQDNPVSQCQDCYLLEKIGVPSMRQEVNRSFGAAFERIETTQDDGSVPPAPFLYLDLRLSNTCNFKCRICSSHYSISWAEDEKKLGYVPSGRVTPTESPAPIRDFLDKNIPHLQRIYFAGGEPLLEEEHYLLLEKLIISGRTDIDLNYNTNFSKLTHRKWDVIELWNQFRSVAVSASLDGVGPQGEYLRKGMVWQRTEENFQALKARAPQVTFVVYPTISAMNAFHLTTAIHHWIRIGMITRPHDLILNILREPKHLNISIYSDEERASLKRHYMEFLASIFSEVPEPLFWGIRSHLTHVLNSFGPFDEDHRKRFAFETTRIDAVRGENFQALFPELATLIRL